MKRTMMTLAAMLLVTIGVFAQGATPLKGDVNGDGKVDVADITAIIQIMKNGGAEVAVTGITLDKSALTLSANGTGTIKATIAPSNATSQGVTWTSDDPSTATVTALTISGENATVTWKKAGTVTITAKAVGDDSKKAACSVTCLAEGVVVYYWYVGQTDPSTMNSINPIVDDMSSPGWREIGTTLPTYNASNMLWNGASNGISFPRDYYYIALPSSSLKIYNSGGDNEMEGYTTQGTKVINGVTYSIYNSNTKALGFAFNIY